ncbi:Trypsin-1 [Orchesella cincta]|uniref:Trypsin-1 n=1 Tax=Orchesella cincta TaxID=48709 RepID=A0A1D2MSA3_ORCCI|nr:Trypsin-1 [Orchesella cincta]
MSENIQVEHDSLISTNNSTSRDLEPFIVGGTIARPNEFPWLVHLQIDGKYFCGGSLISLDTVLTAAHCVYESAGSIIVTAGDHDLLVFEGTEQTSSAKDGEEMLKIFFLKNFPSETTANDIALIKLSKNLTNTDAVSPIPLPEISFVINATGNGTVAGWGATYGNPSPVLCLLKVTVPIVNNTMCRRSYAYLTDSQFCAGQKGKDSCQGDSGGPFICNGTNAVCGIVSYGKGCGKDGYPGISNT